MEADPWMLVDIPPGVEWSGRARYAAAMELYQAGEMSAATLEIYRVCSRLDDEDPLAVLRKWDIGADWIWRLEERRR